MFTNMKKIIVILLAAYLLPINVACASNIVFEEIEVGHAIYKELSSVAVSLSRDVLAKKTDELIKYLEDEDPDRNKSLMGETYSFIYDPDWLRQFRDNANSVYGIISSARKIEIKIEKLQSRNKKHPGTIRVYYYDPERIKLHLPLTQDQRKKWMIDFVTCRFKKTSKGWKASRTLFESETQGP